jgi:hypothetical protein
MIYYVWGVGPASSQLIRNGQSSHDAMAAALSSRDSEALIEAGEGAEPAWAVEVEAEEDEIDIATREDASVLGYASEGGDQT